MKPWRKKMEHENFEGLTEGDLIRVYFPRGGSIRGKVVKLNVDRVVPWILVNVPSGASVTVYENEIGHWEALRE